MTVKQAQPEHQRVKITLSSGREIYVYHIPSGLRDEVNKQHPMPEPPIVEEKAATGRMIKMIIEDDAEYLLGVTRVNERRDKAWEEAYILFALRGVKVPEDFSIEEEFGEMIRYVNPDWEPRKGKSGRKLDYIEYVLLESQQDQILVSKTLNKMVGLDEEVVESIEDSFQGNIPEESD